jgi:hypothetical protein
MTTDTTVYPPPLNSAIINDLQTRKRKRTANGVADESEDVAESYSTDMHPARLSNLVHANHHISTKIHIGVKRECEHLAGLVVSHPYSANAGQIYNLII